MNNGVNNSNVKIEPVATQPTIAPAAPQPVVTQQPAIAPVTTQPTITPATTQQPNITTPPAPVAPAPVAPPEPPKEKELPSLGANVKIAPAQPMYDENQKLIEQPKPVAPAPTPPVLTQPAPPAPGEPPQIQMRPTDDSKPATEEKKEEVTTEPTPKKMRLTITPFLLAIIIGLIIGIIYVNNDKNNTIEQLRQENIVIDTDDKEVDLDINSTIVKDLYTKVATTVKEDLADPYLDEDMKRYLALRQVSSYNKYDSNCNLFNQSSMFNIICNEKTEKPTAFKEENLQLELKKLFGEGTQIPNANIQLGRQCVGEYQYIAERGEYVKGQCTKNNAITFRVDKKITRATKINDEIYIEEEVRYISGEKGEIPESLKDGIYTHRFKLDTNFNYAYISKEYRPKN